MYIKIVKTPTGIRYEAKSLENGDRQEILEWYDFETTITLRLFKWGKTWVINKERRLEQKGVRYDRHQM